MTLAWSEEYNPPMRKLVYQLYPPPFQEKSLKGLYLEQKLYKLGTKDEPFVYANFLSSLDGRIAVDDVNSGKSYLPEKLTTPDDFRLFLELHAQADCLITHGGYLRALAEKRLGNILQVGLYPDTEDLVFWRQKNGLKPQPAIVIASASLDFPMPGNIHQFDQEIFIVTGNRADPRRVKYWEDKGIRVLRAGSGRWVEGRALVPTLSHLGFKSIYLIAGPSMLDTMVRDRQLARLYQTISHQLMGGESFHTLLPGPVLGAEGTLKLSYLYYDSSSTNGVGQWFSQFEMFPGSSDDIVSEEKENNLTKNLRE